MSEIKSCPFCGEAPELTELSTYADGEIIPARIECPKCRIGFEARPKRIVYGWPTKEDKEESIDRAIRLWNRRGVSE